MALVRRRPKGYVGTRHQTIGSDILAVLHILKLPEQVLGTEEARKLAAIDPTSWYPIGWLLELMETLDKKVGHYGLLRMGRTLFQLSHEARVKEVAHSARDILYGLDEMYHFANRGKLAASTSGAGRCCASSPVSRNWRRPRRTIASWNKAC